MKSKLQTIVLAMMILVSCQFGRKYHLLDESFTPVSPDYLGEWYFRSYERVTLYLKFHVKDWNMPRLLVKIENGIDDTLWYSLSQYSAWDNFGNTCSGYAWDRDRRRLPTTDSILVPPGETQEFFIGCRIDAIQIKQWPDTIRIDFGAIHSKHGIHETRLDTLNFVLLE